MQNSGRPKDLEKRQRILEAAKNIFLKQGYHHAGMNQIAQMAGVTKLTVIFKIKPICLSAPLKKAVKPTFLPTHFSYSPNPISSNNWRVLAGVRSTPFIYPKRSNSIMCCMNLRQKKAHW